MANTDDGVLRRKVLKNGGLIGTGSLLLNDSKFQNAIETGTEIGKTHLVEVVIEHHGISGVNFVQGDADALYRTDADHLLLSEYAPSTLENPTATVSRHGVSTGATVIGGRQIKDLVVESDYKHLIQKRVELSEPTKLPEIGIANRKAGSIDVQINGRSTSVSELSEDRYELPETKVEVKTGFDESELFLTTPVVRVRNHGELQTVKSEVVD